MFCSYLSSYRSRKFKKMQFTSSEKAYWQMSHKVATQDTVIIIGSLGHHQLPEYSSENLMPVSTLLLELFHGEYGLREHFAKSDTNFRLPHLTLRWHISVKFWNILIKFCICASKWWTNRWKFFQQNLKLKVGKCRKIGWFDMDWPKKILHQLANQLMDLEPREETYY